LRYIYYIIATLLLISAVIGYALMPARSPEKKAALIINDKTVTTDEFARLFSSQSKRPVDRENFINSLITRELLIQESQKEGIDKEETFRRSIQNFYEQSLIKLLMDRKFASLCTETTDEELDRYISFLKRKVRLTIFSFKTLEEAKGNRPANGETKTLFLEDLSRDLRQPVAALKAGGVTEPIKTGEGYVVARLDRMESPSSLTPAPDREGMRRVLCEEKKEKIINDWIADLRKKATVKILIRE
jgi:hypothetical protein